MTPELERPPRRSTGLHITLILILCLIVARTLVVDQETTRERELSEAITRTLDALASTKLNYNPDLIITTPGKSHIGIQDVFGGAQGVKVAAEWRKLATARTGRAAEWRRLGITLFLFHLPGGLDALRHVSDHFPPPQTSTRKGHIARGRSDPFGHRPTSIPGAAEVAMWEALYGSRPLTPAQTTRYRQMLAQLRLGWFENVAAAQLYAHAGQQRQARAFAETAAQSVGTLWRLQWLNLLLIFFGIIGLFVVCMIGLATVLQRANASSGSIAATYPGALQATAAGPASGIGESAATGAVGMALPNSIDANARGSVERKNVLFPYPVLLLAFIIYLVGQEVVGLLASLALSPFHTRLEQLSTTTLLRLTQLLQVLAYIPILGLPVWILHRRVRFDPLTGERLTWRKMLSHLGFRINNPFADIGAGAIGYLVITPVVLLATLLSNWLFARFHTPQNPAALEMLAAQHSLDRFLVLFVAAVAAPFAEETMFRGILYSALRSRLGIWGGAIVSSSVFALVHPTLPGGFLPIWAVGMGLALVYEWRKSLLPGMVLHGIYNGLITLITFAVFAK